MNWIPIEVGRNKHYTAHERIQISSSRPRCPLREFSPGVGSGGRAGGPGGGGSCAYECPHLHPLAHHRSCALAHSNLIQIQISSFSPSVFTAARNIQVLFQIRPEAIQAPKFESHAACRHDRFLHYAWTSWPNPGSHCWLFGCAPLKARHPGPLFLPFSIKKLSTWSFAVSNFTIIGCTVCQPDFRVFVCSALGRTITLAADYGDNLMVPTDEPVGTSFGQMWRLPSKCGNTGKRHSWRFRANMGTI